MKEEKLFELLSDIEEKYINEARKPAKNNKKKLWFSLVATAACLCIIAGLTMREFNRSDQHVIQNWNESFTAEQYFEYADADELMQANNNASDAEVPYAESRYFSDRRQELENNKIIPVIDTHPLFTFQVNYNADGSLYNVMLLWQRRGDEPDDYSDLNVIAGFDTIPQIEDCIEVDIDKDGNVIEPAITVTKRDGVEIIAEGAENQNKTITYKNDSGWYQITGSYNDKYESLVALLDWFWTHPIDFSQYKMEEGDNYTVTTLNEMPDAFLDYLPDFEQYGYRYSDSSLSLKNGTLVAAELFYVDESDNNSTIHWCLQTEPDYYERKECIGKLEDLTKEQVINLPKPDEVTRETKIQFMQGDYVVVIYTTDIEKAWKLIESLL